MSSIPKVAILTGSAGGIGQEITSMLARQGWNLGLVNRSLQKTKSQLEALRPMYPDQEFAGFTANLMDMSEVKRIAEEISLKFPKISALYNIAGLLTDKRVMSPQDIEGHFAVNTLAPYYLTQLLRQQLGEGARASRHSVVVNFASSAMNGVKELDVETLANPESIGGLTGAYAKSKAALAAASLANREELLKDDIFIQVVDPGPTKTTMTRSSDGMPWFLRLLYPPGRWFVAHRGVVPERAWPDAKLDFLTGPNLEST
ncbi:MAG: SDR family NAD(P)-dependent oxidoreductase [Cyanobacteria bacterium P01_C01_bin.120]